MFKRFTNKNKILLLLASICSVIQCIAELMLPLAMSSMIDDGLLKQSPQIVRAMGTRMLVLCVIMGLFGYCSFLLCEMASQDTALRLRNQAYVQILGLRPKQRTQFTQGTLMTRVVSDADAVSHVGNIAIQFVLEPLVLILAGLLVISRLSPVFGGIIVLFIIIQFGILFLFVGKSAALFEKVRTFMDKLNAHLNRVLTGIRFIKIFRAQKQETEDFRILSDSIYRINFKSKKLLSLFDPIGMLVMNLAIAVLLFYFAKLPRDGSINPGVVLALITYCEQILLSVMTGGKTFGFIAEMIPCNQRMNQLFSLEPEDLTQGAPLPGPVETIAVTRCTCCNEDGREIFRDLDLQITRGQVLSIIGRNGNGQDYIGALLCGQMDIQQGTVMINGCDVHGLCRQDLSKRIVTVHKSVNTINQTIRENITFGRAHIPQADVEKACACARFSDVVMGRADTYDAYLSGGKTALSSGECQRLGIARALAGNPEVLVLNGATSAIDYLTEKEILNNIRSQYPDMTVILITQRIASAGLADRIFCIQGQKMHTANSHRELLANCQEYRLIYDSQAL